MLKDRCLPSLDLYETKIDQDERVSTFQYKGAKLSCSWLPADEVDLGASRKSMHLFLGAQRPIILQRVNHDARIE